MAKKIKVRGNSIIIPDSCLACNNPFEPQVRKVTYNLIDDDTFLVAVPGNFSCSWDFHICSDCAKLENKFENLGILYALLVISPIGFIAWIFGWQINNWVYPAIIAGVIWLLLLFFVVLQSRKVNKSRIDSPVSDLNAAEFISVKPVTAPEQTKLSYEEFIDSVRAGKIEWEFNFENEDFGRKFGDLN